MNIPRLSQYLVCLSFFLLLCLITGCCERTNSRSAIAQRTEFDDLADLYKQGKVEEARAKARNMIEENLANLKKANLAPTDVASDVDRIVLTVSFALGGEHSQTYQAGFLPSEVSEVFCDQLIDDMEIAYIQGKSRYSGVKDLEHHAQAIDEQRHSIARHLVVECDEANVDKVWIRHQKFLESQGFTLEEAKRTNIEERKTSQARRAMALEQQKLLKDAQKDTAKFRNAINLYYKSIITEDQQTLENVLAKKRPGRRTGDVVAGFRKERDEKKMYDKVLVAELDDQSKVNLVLSATGEIRVEVKGIRIEYMKDGEKLSRRENNTFLFVKEDNQWRLWLR